MKDQSFKTHLFSYRFGGSNWSIEIPARSSNEARERLKAIALARYDGVLVATIPAFLSPLGRLAVWFRGVLGAV